MEDVFHYILQILHLITKSYMYTILSCILQFHQGTGKKPMEKQLLQLEAKYPEKARGVAKFNVPLAHMITAGADFMLVPSRFEPCGLIQLHAMRYGTVGSMPPTSSSCEIVHISCNVLSFNRVAITNSLLLFAGSHRCVNWRVGGHC